jgi:hypothetical protein
LNRALRSSRPERRTVTVEQVFARLAGPDGLTATRASFTRRDVVRALCERLPVGTPPREIEQAADRFLASDLVVTLLEPPHNWSLITIYGRRFPAGEDRSYSTPELLLLEGWIIDRALHTHDTGRCRAAEPVVDHMLAVDAFLSSVQQQLVRRLAHDSDGVAVVTPRPEPSVVVAPPGVVVDGFDSSTWDPHEVSRIATMVAAMATAAPRRLFLPPPTAVTRASSAVIVGR